MDVAGKAVEAVGPIQVEKKAEKVCIIGCSDSKNQAPYAEIGEYEFWGVNNLFTAVNPAPFTRWFEIHQITQEKSGRWMRRGSPDFRGMPIDKYLELLGKLPCPVYMQQPNPLVEKSVVMPFAALVQGFGGYFTNTISWQIALAIAEGFKEIRVYGVDMAVDCLAPESKVLTADLRWVQCGDVKVGDELMGFDEHPDSSGNKTRRWRKATVTKMREFSRPCYAIGLEDGTSFIASEQHGWLTHGENINRWKTTKELVTRYHRKNRPTRVLKMVNPWREETSWDAGYLAGAFDGEGHFGQIPRKGMPGLYQNTLGFAQCNNPMHETVARLLEKFGFAFSLRAANGCDTFNLKGGKPEIMRFLGQLRPRRLLPKFKPEAMGEFQSMKDVAVLESRPIGEHPVIGIETDAKTFIADGFASHNSEYHHQRPSCEYFLGLAVGRGIKLWMPDTCDLLKTRFLYGAQEVQEMPYRAKLGEIKKNMEIRRQKAMQERELAMRKEFEYNGALAAMAEIDKIWKNVTGG